MFSDLENVFLHRLKWSLSWAGFWWTSIILWTSKVRCSRLEDTLDHFWKYWHEMKKLFRNHILSCQLQSDFLQSSKINEERWNLHDLIGMISNFISQPSETHNIILKRKRPTLQAKLNSNALHCPLETILHRKQCVLSTTFQTTSSRSAASAVAHRPH